LKYPRNYRKLLLFDFALKQYSKQLKAFIMVKKNHPIRLLFPVIASGEIDQLISSLRTLLIFLPFWERQQLAMDAMEMISKCYVC